MVSYVVTGAGRGLGLAFVQALHARRTLHSPQSRVFALVQDLDSCDVLRKLAGSNIHIIPGDLDEPETLHASSARRLLDLIHADKHFSPLRLRFQRSLAGRWISLSITPHLFLQKEGVTL